MLAAEAKDLCINPDIRLSRFKMPAPGTCLPTAGTFYDGSGHYSRVAGTVCTVSDRTKLFFGLTIVGNVGIGPSAPLFYSVDVDLPGLGYAYDARTAGGGGSHGTGQAAYCAGVPIP